MKVAAIRVVSGACVRADPTNAPALLRLRQLRLRLPALEQRVL